MTLSLEYQFSSLISQFSCIQNVIVVSINQPKGITTQSFTFATLGIMLSHSCVINVVSKTYGLTV